MWPYLDAGGKLLGYVLRFDPASGKEIRPLSWRQTPRGPAWTWEAFDAPRPLYGLDRLAQRPAAAVLIVEGEKAADAAAHRFGDLVVVTWPGGAKAVSKADWSPLVGRKVVIWPDADPAGADAARAVANAARSAGGQVAIAALPPDLPAGWDLADPWPDGFAQPAAEGLIAAALASARAGPDASAMVSEPAADRSGLVWPPGFRADERGLWYEEPGKATAWLSAPFEVAGEARDPNGKGWSVVLRFVARDGREATVIIPRASLASGGAEARNLLADAGLVFSNRQGLRDKLAEALFQVRSPQLVTLATATGWLAGRYVLPKQTIGAAEGETIMFTGDAAALKYGQRGSYAAWRSEVAGRATGNALAMFAISSAFAAVLLRLLDAEGGGFHFRGNSSSGKSTLLITAGSVWGGDPNGGQHGFGHPWRATANALESLALAHNDGLLCLDEFGQVEAADAGSAAYMLANGEGKNRQRSDTSLRSSARWNLLFLSSGEIGLADHVGAARRQGRGSPRLAAGQELRLLDIEADAGRDMGIWQRLGPGETAAQRSEAMKAAAKAHYGHAGPLFLQGLLANLEPLLRDARDHIEGFRTLAVKPEDSGQIARAAQRFALVAAAGELAAGLGVVLWELGEPTRAALAVFERWAAAFGRVGLREERQVFASIVAFIETNRARFGAVGTAIEDDLPTESERKGEARSMVTAGYVQHRDGRKWYNFTRTAFAEALDGYPPNQAAAFLHKAGYLDKDSELGRWTKKLSRDGQKGNYYCVSAAIIERAEG